MSRVMGALGQIVYTCDFVGCDKRFATADEEIHHYVHFHFHTIIGCDVCKEMDKQK